MGGPHKRILTSWGGLASVDSFHNWEGWVSEPKPTGRVLPWLTSDERGLYEDLVHDRFGPSLRLERERIAFAWVKVALDRPPSAF